MQNNNKKVFLFFRNELNNWPLAAKNYAALNAVERRELSVENLPVVIQYNPDRIGSSTAKTDMETIQKRPCFLCKKNRPLEQSELALSEHFVLLVNPYPIFNPHFTIAHKDHIPQQILPFLDQLLLFSKQFSSYTFFYNGPTCGASAPDHLHFQACKKDSLPVETFFDVFYGSIDHRRLYEKGFFVGENNISYFSNDFYSLFLIVSESREDIIRLFEKMNTYIVENVNDKVDYNLLSSFRNGKYRLYIYPRKQHRPKQYYATGENQLLISPGAVDMGGIIITVRKEDFEKITSEDIKDIYRQVSLFI